MMIRKTVAEQLAELLIKNDIDVKEVAQAMGTLKKQKHNKCREGKNTTISIAKIIQKLEQESDYGKNNSNATANSSIESSNMEAEDNVKKVTLNGLFCGELTTLLGLAAIIAAIAFAVLAGTITYKEYCKQTKPDYQWVKTGVIFDKRTAKAYMLSPIPNSSRGRWQLWVDTIEEPKNKPKASVNRK